MKQIYAAVYASIIIRFLRDIRRKLWCTRRRNPWDYQYSMIAQDPDDPDIMVLLAVMDDPGNIVDWQQHICSEFEHNYGFEHIVTSFIISNSLLHKRPPEIWSPDNAYSTWMNLGLETAIKDISIRYSWVKPAIFHKTGQGN